MVLQVIVDDGSRGCLALLQQASPCLALPALTETWWWLRFKGPRFFNLDHVEHILAGHVILAQGELVTGVGGLKAS